MNDFVMDFWCVYIKELFNTIFTGYSDTFHTAISRKVVGKSARDNTERYCGWF